MPNAVDLDHFQRPRPRPPDLPTGKVAVYVGSLHESRLDVELVIETAALMPSVDFVLIGPNALAPASSRRLLSRPNIHLLGARPHSAVPAYLQHADVLIVPHCVSSFTDSLDPIKAYECLAVGRPTVSTPVAGFREHAEAITIVAAREFPAAVEAALSGVESRLPVTLPNWELRVDAIERILQEILRSRSHKSG